MHSGVIVLWAAPLGRMTSGGFAASKQARCVTTMDKLIACTPNRSVVNSTDRERHGSPHKLSPPPFRIGLVHAFKPGRGGSQTASLCRRRTSDKNTLADFEYYNTCNAGDFAESVPEPSLSRTALPPSVTLRKLITFVLHVCFVGKSLTSDTSHDHQS